MLEDAYNKISDAQAILIELSDAQQLNASEATQAKLFFLLESLDTLLSDISRK